MKIKYIIVVLILVLLCNSNVYAYDKKLAKEGDATKVAAWHQSNKGASNPSCPSNAWNFEVASGRTLGEMGCSYFASSYMLVKMGEGDVKNGFTPVEFAKKMSDKKYFMGNQYADFDRIGKLYPNVTCEVCKGNCDGKSTKEQLAYIKGKFNEGYFIVICIISDKSKGHYIFVDGFDDNGDMIVGDSAYQGRTWSETHGKYNGSVATISLFKHKTKKANECPSIYDDQKLGSSELNDEEQELYDNLVQEWGLEGMPTTPNLVGEQDAVYFEDQSGLSKTELAVINEVGNNIEGRHITIADIVNIIISFMGIVLCVYSITLFIAGINDSTNMWIDISVVGRLTFGRCKVINDFDARELKVGKGDFTLKQWGFRCATIFVIGIIVVSGVIQSSLAVVLKFINSRI